MNAVAPLVRGHWWEVTTVILFGITVNIFPTMLSLLALWVGREIAKDPRRKLTTRQNVFLNIGLVIVTFLVVSGKLLGTSPLEVGWASVIGFGVGMNGIVIFELFQRMTYNLFSGNRMNGPPDSSAGK